MSSGQERIHPQRREMEIIRVLFDRHLSDRAIALAEARWPGSGDMVKLAYDWPDLSQQEQRERLRGLGNENISRMRELAELHPELDAAVADLERRGVLEHLESAAQAGLDSTAKESPAVNQDQVAGAGAGAGAGAAAAETASPTPPEDAPAEESGAESELDSEPSDFEEITRQSQEQLANNLAELEVEMPDLDLGLPSTSEVLSTEAERREAAIRNAAASMDRVHERLNRSADAIMSRGSNAHAWQDPTSSSSARDWYAESDSARLQDTAPDARSLPDPDSSSRMIEAPERLASQLANKFVVSLHDPNDIPSADELVALANELGVGLREFEAGPGALRSLYGGLTRHGSSIDVDVGPLPSALAGKNLAVIRGRIHPKLVERMKQGWVDIPGTRATVKFHERARVLIAPTN